MVFTSVREADQAVTESRYRLKFAWAALDKTLNLLNQQIEEYRLIQLIALTKVDQLFNYLIQNGLETFSLTGFTLKTCDINICLPETLQHFMLNQNALGQEKVTVVLGGETAYSNRTIKLADAVPETNGRSAWKALLIWLGTGSLLIGGDFARFESMSLCELAVAPDSFDDFWTASKKNEICERAAIFLKSVTELTDNLIKIELGLQEIQERIFRLRLKLYTNTKILQFMIAKLEDKPLHENEETSIEAIRLASNIMKRLQCSLLTQETIRERGVFFQENRECFSRIAVKPRIEQKKQQNGLQ